MVLALVLAVVLALAVGALAGGPAAAGGPGWGLGCGLGHVLVRGRFGFASGHRRLLVERDPGPAYAQLLLVSLLVVAMALVLALEPRTGLRPKLLNTSITLPFLAGAFLFGIGMERARACGCGSLAATSRGGAGVLAALAGLVIGAWFCNHAVLVDLGHVFGSVATAIGHGGLLMVYGGLLASGCNVNAFLGGVMSFSLHGWIWLAAPLLGFASSLRLSGGFGNGAAGRPASQPAVVPPL